MAVAPILLLFALSSPAQAPPTAAPANTLRVLVLDFVCIDPALGKGASTIAATTLAARGAPFDVVTAADLRAILDREVTMQDVGCNTDSESCMVTLAGALGANNVLHGAINSIGDNTLVSISLFDVDSGKSLGRRVEEVQSTKQVGAATRRLTLALIDELAPPPPLPLLSIAGVAVAGVGAAAALVGLSGAGVAYAIETSADSSGDDKQQALEAHPWFSVLGVAGVVVAAAGGALWVADAMMEAP